MKVFLALQNRNDIQGRVTFPFFFRGSEWGIFSNVTAYKPKANGQTSGARATPPPLRLVSLLSHSWEFILECVEYHSVHFVVNFFSILEISNMYNIELNNNNNTEHRSYWQIQAELISPGTLSFWPCNCTGFISFKSLLVPNACSLAPSCLTLCDSMGYSLPGSSVHIFAWLRREYWSGWHFLLQGDLPDPGIKLTSALAGRFFTSEPCAAAW